MFFSSPISKELVAYIKRDETIVPPRLGALKEVMVLLPNCGIKFAAKLWNKICW